jgi:peptidoglycan hydrolase CwlO-like protein
MISPLVFSYLEKEARKYMTGSNEKYAKLVIEAGDFSETVRRLRSLGIIEQVFP